MSEFLGMGGYAVFVWPAYLLAAVVVVWQLVAPVRCERKQLRRIARRLRQQERT